jgi:hypothetical protein
MRILLTFFISWLSWGLANIMTESSCCFWKGNRSSGRRFCIIVCPTFWADHSIFFYTHHQELAKSVVSQCSSSLLFMIKVMVCHLWVILIRLWLHSLLCYVQIAIAEISLQFHKYLFPITRTRWASYLFWTSLPSWGVFLQSLDVFDFLPY